MKALVLAVAAVIVVSRFRFCSRWKTLHLNLFVCRFPSSFSALLALNSNLIQTTISRPATSQLSFHVAEYGSILYQEFDHYYKSPFHCPRIVISDHRFFSDSGH